MPAISLSCNTSILTAISNDDNYNQIFARQIEGLGNEGDILVAISTSGNSNNVILALEEAKKKKLKTIGLTGESGGLMKEKVDFLINVPSSHVPRIQEAHITIIHIICDLVESSIFKHEKSNIF